jgi:hypothetical protein
MPDPVRVLVLYSHPLMGEGLERMLAAESGVSVHAVDIAQPDAVSEALANEPAVVILEEGGAVDAADVVRRSHCCLVLDVDITTTSGVVLRRETFAAGPDALLASIRQVVGRNGQCDDRQVIDEGRRVAVVPG